MNTGEINRTVPSTIETEPFVIPGSGDDSLTKNASQVKAETASKKTSIVDTNTDTPPIQKNTAGRSIDISL